MMITVRSGSVSLSRACSSMPSMPGILMSNSARSHSRSASSRASRAPASALVSYPSAANQRASESRTTGSSSTMRILPFDGLPINGCGFGRRDGLFDRQRNHEFRACSFLRMHLDRSAMLVDDALGHGEAQSGALLFFLGRKKRLEDVRQHAGGNAGTGVAHAQAHGLLAKHALRGHQQTSAMRHG